jgi:hypothetical protein
MVGNVDGMSRSEIPVHGKGKAGGQSPLLRTAQLNIALERECIVVPGRKAKSIVAGRIMFVSTKCPGLTESQVQTVSSIAGNDQDCI